MDFFNPTGVLAPAGSGWVIQTNTPNSTSQRAAGIGATGDEAAKQLYDARETLVEVYKLFSGTGTLPILGTVVTTWHIDSFSLAYNETDWPTLTINAHKHTGGVGHADMRTYTPSIEAPTAEWGIPEAPFGVTVGTLTTVGLKSAEYSMSVTHLDELSQGLQLGAQNRDGVETISVSYVGNTTPVGPVGWDAMETGGPVQSNEAAESGSASWEHHVVAGVVPPEE